MCSKLTDEWIAEHQDKYRYWKFEKMRLGLIIAALIFGFAYVLLRRQSLVLTVLCLTIPVICVVLDYCYPAYFTLMHPKWEMDRDIRVNRISLVAPFFYSLGLVALATLLNFHFVSTIDLLLSGLILAVVVTAVFLVVLPECRGKMQETVIFLILLAMVGFGITGQANYWLNTGEEETVQAVVTEIDDNYEEHSMWRHSAASNMLAELMGMVYTCTITLPDDTQAEFTMAQVGKVRIGDTATLTYVKGALGLECYSLGRIK